MIIRLLIGISIGACLGGLMGYFGKCTTGACPLTANPYRGAVFGAVIGALLTMSSTGSQKTKNDTATETTNPGALIEIKSVADFERIVLNATQPSLVDFYSNGCPPCRMLAPTIAKLADKYYEKAVISKVNVDTIPELAQKHGIRGIPAVLFFDAGKEVNRLVGLKKQLAYEQILDRLIEKSDQAK